MRVNISHTVLSIKHLRPIAILWFVSYCALGQPAVAAQLRIGKAPTSTIIGQRMCLPIIYEGPSLSAQRIDLSIGFRSGLLRSLDSVFSACGPCDFASSVIEFPFGNSDSTQVISINYQPSLEDHIINDGDTILSICIRLTNDYNFGFNAWPAIWIWEECDDNRILTGDSTLVSNEVFTIENSPCYGYCRAPATEREAQFPTSKGLPNNCTKHPSETQVIRALDFIGGSLNIQDELGLNPPWAGDLDCFEATNSAWGISEGDVKQMAEYIVSDSFAYVEQMEFIEGGSNYLTDANCDSKPATPADLVYLRRRIDGENLNPYLLRHREDTANISFNGDMVVSDYVATAYKFVFIGDFPVVSLVADAKFQIHVKADTTTALLYQMSGALPRTLIKTKARLYGAQASDSSGATVVVIIHR